MHHFESIRVVKLAQLSFICCFLAVIWSCGDSQQQTIEKQLPESNATQVPHTSELASAQQLNGNEAKITSLLYRVQAGDVFRYKFSQDDKLNQDGMNAETSQTLYYTKKIKSIKSDGSIEMTVRYDSIRLNNNYPDLRDSTKRITTSYNSSNPKDRENKDFNQYNGILGEEITALVSKDGHISEISGLTPLLSKIFGDMKDSLNPKMREQALEQIKVQLYQRPLQQEYQNFPDGGTIDSTNTWQFKERSPLSGIFLVDNSITYHLDAVKQVGSRKTAFISAKLVSSIDNPAQKQGIVAFKLNKSEISGSGETILDVEKGYTIQKKNTIRTFIDATMSDAKTKQSKRAVQSLVSTMKIELIK